MEIPRIGVSADIRGLGTLPSGELAVPDGPRDVGWFAGGPVPGDPGNAILTGHLDWRTGEIGVFWRLRELAVGDPIFVRNDRERLTFVVESSKLYGRLDAPVGEILGFAIGRVITVITCEGDFIAAERDYTHRRVVRARLA
ncbi:MAG: class F sortase [Chloroflexi bacterium]|nr:class F sortase [Chloroflexota bacterium]